MRSTVLRMNNEEVRAVLLWLERSIPLTPVPVDVLERKQRVVEKLQTALAAMNRKR